MKESTYRRICEEVQRAFPECKVLDGWDGNPLNELGIGLEWPDGTRHAMRSTRLAADMADQDADGFVRDVVSGLQEWRKHWEAKE